MRSEFAQRMNSQTVPSPGLVEQTLAALRPSSHTRRLRPALVLALALIVCLASFSALAATDESTYQLLYRVSPALAQALKPVREACEDQGIRMEVVSASLTESTADIIVTLRDLTGNRLDETIDLFDSYSIRRPFEGSAGCTLLEYDPDTQTAYFSIHIEEKNGTPIAGSKITFSVSRLLGQKTETHDEPIPLSLDALAEADTQTVRLSGFGGAPEDEPSREEWADYPVLAPQGTLHDLGDGMAISAVGLIDGRLRVQLAVCDNLNTDNHGFLTLRAADGTERQPLFTVGFNNVEGRVVPERVDYTEAVFEVPEGGLTGYGLYADTVRSGMLIEGNWQVTFLLEE